MLRTLLALPLALAAVPSFAQQAGPAPTLAPGATLLTVSAEGRTLRQPDVALFTAGVTTQGPTAAAALGANSSAMARVIAALKAAGIADRDIQTSNLSLNPVYAQPRRLPDGTVEQPEQRIVGYAVNNTVSVRQRKLADYGKVIDTLVSAGANQVNGPSFMLDDPDPAMDEARTDAVKRARARAELYARAAGLRVVRVLSIAEGGGYSGPPPVVFARSMMAPPPVPPPPPVQAGEVQTSASVTVQFELAQ